MKTVLFLTASFPYLPGEQFIEDEIFYWSNLPGIRVVLLPMTAKGTPRATPKDIAVDLTLAEPRPGVSKLGYIFKALCSPVFRKEISYIRQSGKPLFYSALIALKTLSSIERIVDALRLVAQKYEDEKIAYCYWNDIQAYAASRLKSEGLLDRVVSRAHGFDLYKNRRKFEYMPLKQQLINSFDQLLAISNQGADYMQSIYGVTQASISVSRLGVPVPSTSCLPSPSKTINIVSISSCIRLKRVDKIINAIKLTSDSRKDINFKWTHIGDGPLLNELRDLAERLLKTENISFELLGMLPNSEVKNYFGKNQIDMFINASESEGVPVSIMEAMSYGVPAIAPDIGGIPEIINNSCGILMSSNPDENEISKNILSMIDQCKDSRFRSIAQKKIAGQYNAHANYSDLASSITN